MYPSRFRYEAPGTVEEAIELLRAGQGEAKVLAGGQSLLPMMKLRFASPGTLIDINNIAGLAYHRAKLAKRKTDTSRYRYQSISATGYRVGLRR